MAPLYIFLSFVLGMSAALPHDMTEKMLVFSQESNTAHVRLTTSRQNLGPVTVCVRYFTELTRFFTIFSLATPSLDNAVALYRHPGSSEVELGVRNLHTKFKGLEFKLNRWQSVCATWDAASGLVQVWLDGKPSTMKFLTNSNITGPIIIVLGQDQDSFGGGFDIKQSFVGMMTDVHMWDYVLSPLHIDNYSQRFNFPAGNILNWRSIEFQVTGRILVQKEQHQN